MLIIKRDWFKDRTGDRGVPDGSLFFAEVLEPQFAEALKQRQVLLVDMDGMTGFSSGFLQASFGALGKKYGASTVLEYLKIKCIDEPYLIKEIRLYIIGFELQLYVDQDELFDDPP